MTTTDTEGGLLRAIAADPADDTVRLAYADWLEENAREVECRACLGTGSHALDPYELAARYGRGAAAKILDAAKCLTCGGSGRVGDGKRERAEFIRVQVELAAGGCLPGLCICTRGCDELRRLGRELWRANRRGWWKPLDDIFPGMIIGDYDVPDCEVHLTGDVICVVRRGFVDEVRCPLGVLLGGACGRCGGEGRVGRHYDPASDTMRGGTRCPDCGGTGRTEGVARELFAAHPVVQVGVTDRDPHATPTEFQWWESEDEDVSADEQPTVLPWFVFERLPHKYARYIRDGVHHYESPEAANDALSAALVAVCRARADLPELPR